ncbi:PLP-dependent transferase [Byssothecium circinans]|uniref:PLP-dependent transferase n=1 Tax=Byssothecium circinans TaxID=147558 RepID=A0A6A5UC17_9PLEO|nr:PLP-dependent transferase [Byssothecium circinans]
MGTSMGKSPHDIDSGSTADPEQPVFGTVEELGYDQVYRRVFKTIVNVSLVFAFSSPLSAILLVGSFPLTYGGYWGLTWGWAIPAIVFFPQALAVSELSSSMPINGAFYWWTAALAPPRLSRPLSFAFGWFSMLSGITSMASSAWATASALSVSISMLKPGVDFTNAQVMGIAFAFTLLRASMTLLGTEKIEKIFMACETSLCQRIEATRPLLHYGIGAIIVEPLQSAGGIVPATREFLQFLRAAANTLNAVLIFDEVVTSRLHYHGLQRYYDVAPDLTALGKYVGGGFSSGCFGGRRDIMLQFDPATVNHLTHSGTFNNNVFTMTVGIAGMKLLTPDEISRLNALGDRVRAGINERTRVGHLDDLQAIGFGSLIGLRFSGSAGEKLLDVFYFEMLKKNVVVGRRGFIMLNLMHEDVHVEQLLAAVSEIVDVMPHQV